MEKWHILFPNQLFAPKFLDKKANVLLVEHAKFFADFRYHKKKLLFHKATVNAYADELKKEGFKVSFIKSNDFGKKWLSENIDKRKKYQLSCFDPVDDTLLKDVRKQAESINADLEIRESPCFICSRQYLYEFFRAKKKFSMQQFYISRRKEMNILVKNGRPETGKWSLDAENRKKLPKDITIPKIYTPQQNQYTKSAKEEIEKNFPDNFGSLDDFFYPVKRSDAERWLEDFIENRLENFGPYEDAISKENPFIFHSLLSPLLNTGLLTPEDVVSKAIDHNSQNKIPLNSLEGFIRQVTGWREFMRAVYLLKGKEGKESNFWRFKNKLPDAFYTGTIGIEPIDYLVKRSMKNAYLHHIERLMVMSNFMLLCEIDPKEVYKWFMEIFIDAYEWVMVPNVFGMSQYADGGMITTKPYISSSNYILKMSDFKKGKWCEIWDGLYWRFINKHKKFFAQNPRMKIVLYQIGKMSKQKLNSHLKIANEFLEKYF